MKGGGTPPKHTLKFCQFVELNPKGLGLKYFAGWMFLGGVIKISKFEKMGFSSYFEVFDKSSSYRVPCSYKAFGKNSVHGNLFLRFAAMG